MAVIKVIGDPEKKKKKKKNKGDDDTSSVVKGQTHMTQEERLAAVKNRFEKRKAAGKRDPRVKRRITTGEPPEVKSVKVKVKRKKR